MTQNTKKTSLKDNLGHEYELKKEIGKGGQGVVISTQYADILVKLCDRELTKNKNKQNQWLDKIQILMQQNLYGLNIAYPVALITQPRAGYVMKYMDGLEPLTNLFDKMQQAEDVVETYAVTGGVMRRLHILAKLAKILAELHGRGLVYGDLAPNNIFISQDVAYHEVWLIDCDNISSLSRTSQQKIHTPDFGAPEIMRGESGINSYTDSWSFGVVAYWLLTGCHPLKGNYVVNGSAEVEDRAMKGELPWINHSSDHSNASENGLPWELISDKPLKQLFTRCFENGLNEPQERPSLSEWAEVLAQTVVHCGYCSVCDNGFILNKEKTCPFCDTPQSQQDFVLIKEYQFIPKEELQHGLDIEIQDNDCWFETNQFFVLNKKNELKIEQAQIRLSNGEIHINHQQSYKNIFLQQDKTASRLPENYILSYQGKRTFLLHFGQINTTHKVWKFTW